MAVYFNHIAAAMLLSFRKMLLSTRPFLAPVPSSRRKHVLLCSIFSEDTSSLDPTVGISVSSCEEGSYVVGVLSHYFATKFHGFQLICRQNNPPSCPTPEGLLVGDHERTSVTGQCGKAEAVTKLVLL